MTAITYNNICIEPASDLIITKAPDNHIVAIANLDDVIATNTRVSADNVYKHTSICEGGISIVTNNYVAIDTACNFIRAKAA